MITEQDRIRWRYNCKDIIYTREIALAQIPEIKARSSKLQEFYHFQQHESAPALVNVMNRGIRIDLAKKEELNKQLTKLLAEVEEKINYLVGESFNPKSLPQIKAVLKDLCGIKPKINKKTKTESFASAYMLEYLKEYPMYSTLIALILEYRSIGVFLRTFVSAKVDEDGRMRTAYNIAGTKTYRLSSRKNAFGNGANLANIPSKGKIDLKYSLASIEHSEDTDDNDDIILADEYEGITKLPNCKEFFIPDEDYTFFNADYSGADAMVVAWDSDCKWLQKFFTTSKQKLYIYVASYYLQKEITTDDPWYKKFKQFVHLTNYGGMEEKAALASGMLPKDAKKIRQWYFGLCPEIPEWHRKIANDIKTKGYVENIFGAQGWFLNKDCPTILNQAIAWIPQSTIAILVNKGLVNIEKENQLLNGNKLICGKSVIKDMTTGKLKLANHIDNGSIYPIDVLLQVHDALAGQFKNEDKTAPERIIKHMRIELPYKKPLIIPVDISYDRRSYGHCK